MANQSVAEAADEQFDLVGLTGEEQELLTRLEKASRGSGAMTQGAMTDAAKRRGDEMEPRPKARGVGSYVAVSVPEAPELEQNCQGWLAGRNSGPIDMGADRSDKWQSCSRAIEL